KLAVQHRAVARRSAQGEKAPTRAGAADLAGSRRFVGADLDDIAVAGRIQRLLQTDVATRCLVATQDDIRAAFFRREPVARIRLPTSFQGVDVTRARPKLVPI